uniref:Uncharacterized protein n=1 Tax=Chenopodium quinoa TaxID=63459 RepID=A0A803NB49_CHEQI
MRQVWRMYKIPNLLASKCFVARYGGDPLSLGYSGKHLAKSSWAAKSLVRVVISMKGAIGKRIGNGKDNSILQDIWVKEKKISRIAQPLESQSGKVSDLLTTDRRWNANLIWKSFEEDTARDILSIYVPTHECKEEFRWLAKKNGEFTFKSGYWVAAASAKVSTWRPKQEAFWKL